MLNLDTSPRSGGAFRAAGGPRILILSGSPTTPSKTATLADMVGRNLQRHAARVDHIHLKDLPSVDLVRMNTESKPIAKAIACLEKADGVVIATPTFKASFSGLTKLFLDLLPQFALTGKVVLPLATGGSLAHVLALDYSLRPVVQSMGARWVVPSFFVTSDAFVPHESGHVLSGKFEAGLGEVLRAFQDALDIPVPIAA